MVNAADTRFLHNALKRYSFARNAFCLLLFLTGFIVSADSFAQKNNFTASVSKSEISLSEPFEITFKLNGNGENFKAPSFKDFYVLMGPSQSSSMQVINGYMTQSVAYTYLLQPKATGKFTIGVASIEINGKHVQSDEITITVDGSKPQAQNGSEPTDAENEDLLAQIGKKVFIKANIDKKEIYQGEALVVDYKLYTQLSLAGFNLKRIPTPNGFWSQDIKLPGPIQLYREIIDNVQYGIGDLKKSVLFPLRSGKLEIEPMEAESVVRVQTKRRSRTKDPFSAIYEDFFDDPFFGGYEEVNYVVRSKPVQIQVRPLPADAPASFAGAVGSFSMKASIDKPKGKAHEPISLKIRISGKGNLTLIDPLQLDLPADIEIYDPKINDNLDVTENGVSGTRTFEYLLIPKQAGNYTLKPIEFSYFDLEKKEYVGVRSPEFAVEIEKGSPSLASSNYSDNRMQTLMKDFRPIITDTISLRKKSGYFFGSPLFYSLLAAPALLFAFFLVYLKKQENLAGDPVLMQNRQANRMAGKRLAEAEKHLKANNGLLFYEEAVKALWGYISGKLGIPVANLSKEAIVTALQQRNTPEELIQQLTATIDTCEFARYAPAGNLAAMETVYENATQIITRLEKHLSKKL